MKQHTQNNTETAFCKHCVKKFDKKEVARIYGKESGVYLGNYCSAACYTESTMKDAAMPEKGNGHTPGKWYVSGFVVCTDERGGGGIIARIPYYQNGDPAKLIMKGEAEANAKLIASAPQLKAENEKQADTIKELLEVLKLAKNEIIELTDSDQNNANSVLYPKYIDKVIAKHNQ